MFAREPVGDSRPATQSEQQQRRLGLLISGGAETCLALEQAIADKALPGWTISLVVCSVAGAPGAAVARAAGLRTVTLEGRGREQRDYEEALDALLRRMGVDLLCLCGYDRVFSREFVRRWTQRILAAHGSLLPAFPGAHPARQALAFGARVTGCTVSFVDESLETFTGGPVVAQRAFAVDEDATEESLSARLLAEEPAAYLEAIRRVGSGAYTLYGRRYRLRTAAEEPAGKEPGQAPRADGAGESTGFPESA